MCVCGWITNLQIILQIVDFLLGIASPHISILRGLLCSFVPYKCVKISTISVLKMFVGKIIFISLYMYVSLRGIRIDFEEKNECGYEVTGDVPLYVIDTASSF